MSTRCALELLESNDMIDKMIVESTIKVGYAVSKPDYTVKSERSINLPLIFIKVKKEDEDFKDKFLELMESKGYISPRFNTASGYYCKEKDVDAIIEKLIEFSDKEKFYIQFEKENMWKIANYIETGSQGKFTSSKIGDRLHMITDKHKVRENEEKRIKQKQEDLDFLEKVFK